MNEKTTGARWTLVALATLLCTLVAPAASAKSVRLDAELAHPMMLAPGGPQPAYLRVALTGLEAGDARLRAPVNVAIVLDRSGSMQGEKLVEAKRAAMMALDRLRDDDIVSIVTYESTVHVLVPATKLSDRATIRAAIQRISAGGSTALFAGVSKGAAELRKFLDHNRVNRVILLSDGLANVGPGSPGQLGDLGASLAAEGISVTTIGLGLQYNEDLMTRLAFKSDGNHFFVEDARDLELAWATEFGDVLSVVAQDVSIRIRFPQGIRPVRVLGREAQIEGQVLQAKLNHVFVDQTKYLLVELEVPPGKVGQVTEIAKVEASYFDLAKRSRGSERSSVAVGFTDSAELVAEKTRAEVMVAVISQIAAEKNEIAVELRDAGKLEEARSAFLANLGYLSNNAQKYDNEGLARDAETQSLAAESVDEEEEWNRARKAQREYQVKTKQQGAYSEKRKD